MRILLALALIPGACARRCRWHRHQRHNRQAAARLHRHALPDHKPGPAESRQRQNRRAGQVRFHSGRPAWRRRRSAAPAGGLSGSPVQQDHPAGPAAHRRRRSPFSNATKTPGDAKVDQHFLVLEPSPSGAMQVTEGVIYKNDGKTTWNDPDHGTFRFALPDGAQGKVEVNVTAPGGLPIRRSADPAGKPNQFKVDFAIKPGETEMQLSWSMPFNSPGVFEDHMLSKAGVLAARRARRRRFQRRRCDARRAPAPTLHHLCGQRPRFQDRHSGHRRLQRPARRSAWRPAVAATATPAPAAARASARISPNSTACSRPVPLSANP